MFSCLARTRSLKHGHQDFSLCFIVTHNLPPVLFFFFFSLSSAFFFSLLDLLSGMLFRSGSKYTS